MACPVPLRLFCDYLYDMKATVDAKIKTVQYMKHKVEECIPPHLSRVSFYKRMQMETSPAKLAWGQFVALGAKYDLEAAQTLGENVAYLYGWPWSKPESYEGAVSFLEREWNLTGLDPFVQACFA